MTLTYGEWIDICERGTSGDQVYDILASWKADAFKTLEENIKLETKIAELKNALSEWYEAWEHDCISPTPNGNTWQGIDEGVVMSNRIMKPLVERTRNLLDKAVKGE